MSLRNLDRFLSKNALAFFLRQAILSRHQEASAETLRLSRVLAHEIRTLSSSLLFKKNRSLRDIQDSEIWHCNSTFVSCYLRDVSHSFLDVSALGPVVVAGRVV